MGWFIQAIAQLTAVKRAGRPGERIQKKDMQHEPGDVSRRANPFSVTPEGAWRLDQLSPGG
ncbi:MAG: hypothetical protein ACOY90_04660 [Candidatus Zhuqueibacterota bacterium]